MRSRNWRSISNYSGCPCMGCTEREEGCHGRCGRYQEWTKKNEQTRNLIREERRKDSYRIERILHIKARIWANNGRGRNQ